MLGGAPSRAPARSRAAGTYDRRVRLGPLALFAVVAACAPGVRASGASSDALARASDDPIEVRVTIVEFAVTSSRTTFVAGQRYRFVVANEGTLPHELLVIPPLRPGAVSLEASRARALGVIEARNLAPGGTHALDLAFDRAYPAGSLELACHIVGHYEAGQRLPIVVTPRPD